MYMRSEVSMVMKIQAVTTYSLVDGYKHFREAQCSTFWGRWRWQAPATFHVFDDMKNHTCSAYFI
jgi:hypothetical protein